MKISIANVKKLLTEENKTKMIGLLTILVSLWLILYLIPELFVSLFNTFLGILILVVTVILITMYNPTYGITLGVLLLIIYRFSHLSHQKEGFEWSKQSTNDFLLIQNTIHPKVVFDVNMIQRSQASQEEVDYFNRNGMWPWSEDVINLYKEAVMSNPYIRTYSGDAVNYARKIYNQAAILRILSNQTKEGKFLLNGVLVSDLSGNPMEDLPSGFGSFGYESGLIGNLSDDVIKCNSSENPTLERITYTGKGGIFGEQTSKTTNVDYNDLENIIPGFTFVNGPCNPCGALKEQADYSCPFKLKIKNKPPFISSVWQYLWNINDNPLVSQPSFLNENINPEEFPLLSEIQTELNEMKKNN